MNPLSLSIQNFILIKFIAHFAHIIKNKYASSSSSSSCSQIPATFMMIDLHIIDGRMMKTGALVCGLRATSNKAMYMHPPHVHPSFSIYFVINFVIDLLLASISVVALYAKQQRSLQSDEKWRSPSVCFQILGKPVSIGYKVCNTKFA